MADEYLHDATYDDHGSHARVPSPTVPHPASYAHAHTHSEALSVLQGQDLEVLQTQDLRVLQGEDHSILKATNQGYAHPLLAAAAQAESSGAGAHAAGTYHPAPTSPSTGIAHALSGQDHPTAASTGNRLPAASSSDHPPAVAEAAPSGEGAPGAGGYFPGNTADLSAGGGTPGVGINLNATVDANKTFDQYVGLFKEVIGEIEKKAAYPSEVEAFTRATVEMVQNRLGGNWNVVLFNLGQPYQKDIQGDFIYQQVDAYGKHWGIWAFQGAGTFINQGAGGYNNWIASGANLHREDTPGNLTMVFSAMTGPPTAHVMDVPVPNATKPPTS